MTVRERRRVRNGAAATRERSQLVPVLVLRIKGPGVLAALVKQHVPVHLDALGGAGVPAQLLARRDLHDRQALIILAPVLQELLQNFE